MPELEVIAQTEKAVRLRFPNGRACWLPNQVAEYFAEIAKERTELRVLVDNIRRELRARPPRDEICPGCRQTGFHLRGCPRKDIRLRVGGRGVPLEQRISAVLGASAASRFDGEAVARRQVLAFLDEHDDAIVARKAVGPAADRLISRLRQWLGVGEAERRLHAAAGAEVREDADHG